jgi:peptide/nickel transport system permease protein
MNKRAKGRFFRELKRQRMAIIGLFVFCIFFCIALFLPLLPVSDPFALSLHPFQPPSCKHFMGTDNLGRDIFSQVVWGTRASLMVGVLSAGLSAVIGIIIGGIAGYYGSWVDDLLSRIIDVFLIMPIFFLLILIVSLFGCHIFFVIFSIGMVTWPRNARIMRAQALALKKRAYVTAAIGSGASNLRVLFLHVVPNGVSPIIAYTVILMGQAILVEAGLSFLGLGDPNVISWGQMIRSGQQSFATAWWISFFPGLMLMILVSAVNFFGDGLSVVLNPRMTRQ